MSGWAGLKKRLFGDVIEIVIHSADEASAHKILGDAYKEALRLEKIFNFYDKGSFLSRLNYRRSLSSCPELVEVLSYALELSKETGGLYDVSLGKNFLARKSHDPLLPLSCSYKDIRIVDGTITLLHSDVIIDLGSLAKGYIADKVGAFLRSHGVSDFVIDARGDILLSGLGTPIIRVQHPRDDTSVMTLNPRDCGVATSGDYAQYDGSYEHSHILNRNEYISVTVIAPTLTKADVFATVCSVMPKKKLKSFLAKFPEVSVLTIDNKLKKEYYNHFLMVAKHD